jgi:hypothetical protein
MREAVPPLPQYVFMAWCLVKQRDNFTFNILSQGNRVGWCGLDAFGQAEGPVAGVPLKAEIFLTS